MKSNSEFLDKSLMLQAMKLYNEFPYEQRQKLDKAKNIKGFLKEFYLRNIWRTQRNWSTEICWGTILSFSLFLISVLSNIFFMFLVFQTL